MLVLAAWVLLPMFLHVFIPIALCGLWRKIFKGSYPSLVSTGVYNLDTEGTDVLCAAVELEKDLSLEDLKARAKHLLLEDDDSLFHYRVKSRTGLLWPVLSSCNVDLGHHVFDGATELGLKGADVDMSAATAAALKKRFDNDRPPWALYTVGKRGLLVVVHRSVADGNKLLAVASELASSDVRGVSLAQSEGENKVGISERKRFVSTTEVRADDQAPDEDEDDESFLVVYPLKAWRLFSQATRLLFPRPDSASRVHNPNAYVKDNRLKFITGVPLSDVRSVAQAMGVTKDDVVLSCAAAGVAQCLDTPQPGSPQSDLFVTSVRMVKSRRAAVESVNPLSVHDTVPTRYVYTMLPVDIGESNWRLRETYRLGAEARKGFQHIACQGLLRWAGFLPPFLSRLLFGRTNFILTETCPTSVMYTTFLPYGLEQAGAGGARSVSIVSPARNKTGVSVTTSVLDGQVCVSIAVDIHNNAVLDAFENGFISELRRLIETVNEAGTVSGPSELSRVLSGNAIGEDVESGGCSCFGK